MPQPLTNDEIVTLPNGEMLPISKTTLIDGVRYSLQDSDIVYLTSVAQWYRRDSDELVFLRGKYRRKTSLKMCSDGQYETRDYTVTLHDGALVSRDRHSITEYKPGVYYMSSDIFIDPMDGTRFLMSDTVQDSFGYRSGGDRLISLSGGRTCYKPNARKLLQRVYGDNQYEHRTLVAPVCNFTGSELGLVLASDLEELTMIIYGSLRNILNCQPTTVLRSDAEGLTCELQIGDSMYTVLQSNADNINQQYEEHVEELRDSTEFSGSIVDSKMLRLSETFGVENPVRSVRYGNDHFSATELTYPQTPVIEVRNGKAFKSDKTRDLITFLKTDGMRYSFGVEVEVVAGQIPKSLLRGLGVSSVHDGSITSKFRSATEYKIGPLRGDQGLAILEKFLNLVQAHCLVDDSCGVHVHIGNIDNNAPDIVFGKNTLFNLVKLGTKIERNWFELFSHKRYGSKYCKSILEFSDIDIEKNYKELLGVYIFASSRNSEEIKDINKLVLNHRRNKSTSQSGNYPESRYRWLNLVGVASKHKQQTVEFRHHPGSTNPDKIIAHLMTCMAFVRICSDRMALVSKCNTIEDVVSNGLPKPMADKINAYYAERRAHYKTDLSIYNMPHLISRKIDLTKQDPLPSKRKKTGLTALEKTIKDWVNEDYVRELETLTDEDGKIYQGHFRIGGFDPYWGNIDLDNINLSKLKENNTEIYMDYCEATVSLIEELERQNNN